MNQPIPPTVRNLARAAQLADAWVRGLLPPSHQTWPAALLRADPDGHTRGAGRDFGDGPILWAAVKLWHAIDEADPTDPR